MFLKVLGSSTFVRMNKFIAVLSNPNQHLDPAQCESFAGLLQSTFPKALNLLPHILIFESDLEIADALASLPKELRGNGQVLLFHVSSFRGSASIDRITELNQFFQ